MKKTMSEYQKCILSGGAEHDMAQIYQHLREKSVLELTDELAVLTEQATEDNCDMDLLHAYLQVLDEKDPVPFEIQPDEALQTFYEKHQLLVENSTPIHRKRMKSNRFFRRIVAGFAVAVLCSSVVAQACGIDIWGMIARFTSETFHMGAVETPYAEVKAYPIEEGESATFASLQEAVDAFKINAPLAPKWIPERFDIEEVYAQRNASGISIYADYAASSGELSIRFNQSARADQRTVEKDSEICKTHNCGGILHYIIGDQSAVKIIWNNGEFECCISGAITEEEAIESIDSIYKE